MGKKKNHNKENSNTGNVDKENDNKKNNKNSGEEGEEKKKNEGGDAAEKKNKKEEKSGSITVVLKVDLHCEGCASKIAKCVRSFEGVETVKAETATNKITIVGAVDPSKIRDKLTQKTKKKIDLISPQPKKDKDKEESKQENKAKDKSSDDKKPKEAPVTTAVLKLGLHCEGCIEKIRKIVTKTKGVLEMSFDKQKDLVTVRGTMDVKALTVNLKEKLKRSVEIVPPKKEKEEKDSKGGDKDNNNNGSGGKKKKGGGGGDAEPEAEGGNGGGGKVEGNKMEYVGMPGPGYGYMGMPGPGYGYGYQMMHGGYGYGYGYPYPVGTLHAPQTFSDENPNACVVM